MRPRRLFWQLFLSHLFIIVLILAAVSWLSSHTLRRFYYEETRTDLAAHAELVARQVEPWVREGRAASIDSLCKAFGGAIGMRVTVIRPDGLVLGDSHEDPQHMARHGPADRPEVAQVLAGRVGVVQRYSDTLRRSMLYVAIPVVQARASGDQVIAVIRTALPLATVESTLEALTLSTLAGGAILAALLALFAYGLSRRVSRPLEALRAGAERFARGDFAHRLPEPDLVEAQSLADSMNRMASQLQERLEAITRQHNELETILRGMAEGILAVDRDQRIVTMNASAADILGVRASDATGRPIHEVVRNPALQELLARTLAAGSPVEGDLVLQANGERQLHVRGAVLRDALEQETGALLVVQDVTRLRHLERMRRDFVANVSHELKTPVTSIKGAIETLVGGALADPDAAERFLAILARQADRLEAIIEDLLRLSRIEEETGRGAVELKRASIEMVLAGAAQACQTKAREKQVEITVACAPDLEARINAPLLENAVVNLIDNAVKYSDPGGSVQVAAIEHGGECLITVTDQGCGIDQRFHERIFERFFRVDRARSRELGGTGLGLAIVRHIVLAHGGRVTIESAPGRGSTFGIALPGGSGAAPDAAPVPRAQA